MSTRITRSHKGLPAIFVVAVFLLASLYFSCSKVYAQKDSAVYSPTANPVPTVTTLRQLSTTAGVVIFFPLVMNTNPTPTITALMPDFNFVDNLYDFDLTVTGTNFTSDSVVNWNGESRATTYISSTQLTAVITPADTAVSGAHPITVFNPAPGGGVSNELNFMVYNLFIREFYPSSAYAGDAGFTLIIYGHNIQPGMVAMWNGVVRPSTFIYSNGYPALSVEITAADIAKAGTYPVTLTDSAPGDDVSNTVYYMVYNRLPTITSLSQDAAIVGDPAFNLTVTGTNFVSDSVVEYNGVTRPTTYVSATQLTAEITAADISVAGTESVTVFNPAPGGGVSNAVNFTVFSAVSVNITYIHECRVSPGYISGTVQIARPADFKIAVYINVDGVWWTKPYFASPLTSINTDRTWSAYVTSGGNDSMATQFAAFLVPNGYNPPMLSGSAQFPQELYDNSVANDIKQRDCPLRPITFSGYTWYVKAAVGPTGPGPNYFTDDPGDVFVDANGYLHLKIVNRDGKWWCSEVINALHLGYGKYIFKLASPVNGLDPNVVLGLFTYDITSTDYANREIDMEFSTWAIPGNQNSQYLAQPYTTIGNIYRFDTLFSGATTQGFSWQPTGIFFQSLEGDAPFPGSTGVINSWTYTGGSNPVPGNENARINFWLFNGAAPAGPMEIIVKSFQFISQ